MNVGEAVVLVRDVDGVAEGTHGRVKDTKADRVMVECEMREHSAIVLTHMWDVLPERLWGRLIKRRRGQSQNWGTHVSEQKVS
jgi:hypothetical protein